MLLIGKLSISLFRSSATELHSRITGSMRQKFFPFFWITLLGLQPQTKPHDDTLLQSALALNHIQILWLGINSPSEKAQFTISEIENLQNLCREACFKLSECLRLRISTKILRLMCHITDHVKSFGFRRRGNNDEMKRYKSIARNPTNSLTNNCDYLVPNNYLSKCISGIRSPVRPKHTLRRLS